MKLVTVLAVAAGFVAAPLIAAGPASALPPATCDGADCVPGVPHNATEGGSCVMGTRYAFGLGSSGNAFICSSRNQWIPTNKTLVGVRPLASPCEGNDGMAQSPDGIPMSCKTGAWIGDYDMIFYSKTY
ncbi:MAG TPA: hypothetical protein VH496_06420 [Mycobacterium sp.]|jgi:hypothetical protein